MEKRSAEFPDKPAFIFRDQPVTFSQLKDSALRFAAGLQELGLKKGDRVALYLPGWPEYAISYLAAWCCGAVVVPLDFMLTADELESCISHSGASFLIAKPKATIDLQAIAGKCPVIPTVIVCSQGAQEPPDALSVAGMITAHKPAPANVRVQENDPAIIFYTSGTTGKPKGVLISYRQLEAPPESMKFFVGDMGPEDIAVCALPFSHLGGLIYVLNCLSYGLTVVLMERFIPAEFLKNIAQYRATCFWIVPSMYYAMLQMKEFETFDLTSLRWIVTFGASNSPEALRRFHQFCPTAHLLNGWGLTETNAPTTVIKMGSKKIESVGRPAPWIDVKIMDDDDVPLPAGSVGEVVVKSWVVTEGYYKDPGLTAEVMRGGWFHTGDLGKTDADGDLYIVGRKKEMIKVAGEIVFEPEVEAAIYKHPDVAEAAVVGIPDKLRGEVPKAYVALKEGKLLQEEELRAFLKQHLAHFKVPHHFEFMPQLPKNRTGKIDKALLRRG